MLNKTSFTPLHEVYFRVRGNHLQAHGALEELRFERAKNTARQNSYELIEIGHGQTAGLIRSADRQRLQRMYPGLECQALPKPAAGDTLNFGFALALPRSAKERDKKPVSDVIYLLEVLRKHGLEAAQSGCRKLRTRKIKLKSSSEKNDFTGLVVDFAVAAKIIDADKCHHFMAHGHKTLRGFGIGLPIPAGTGLYAPFALFDQ